MKRMEVPRLPLHNLQGNTDTAPVEAVKHSRPASNVQHQQPVVNIFENQSEPSPPPSRILRSGKRVPVGTGVKVPPRTASKASRVAIPAADELAMSQATRVPVTVDAETPKQSGTTPAVTRQHAARPSSLTSQGTASTQARHSPELAGHSAYSTGTASPVSVAIQHQQMSSSPLLLDIQTSVSPTLSSPSQPSQQPATPTLTQTAAESSSPIALAPGSAAQSEAPTPTLVPKGSVPRPALRQSPADASPATSPASPQGSPRDILSSLQQMNLQSRPFHFAQDTSESLSDAAREQTPEPFYVSSPGHADIEQTPEQSQELQGFEAIRTEATDERIEPIAAEQSEEVNNEEEQHGEGEKGEDQPVGYISRRTTDPYMQKKLRDLQKEMWTPADDTLKVHKSKLEVAKEQAAAARSSQLSDVDKAAVHRLVTNAFQRVVATGGQSLGETMVKHKSRLEREKEVAQQERKAEEAAQALRAKRKVVHTPGSWTKQGLGELGKHKSRLEKEKEAAAAARKTAGGSPALGRLPSYMRPTSASKAMQKGLGEDMTKPLSRLEREKEAAAAAARAAPSSEVRRSASGLGVRSKVAEAWQGQGLESVMHKRKSKLEQDKENAAAAAAGGSANSSPKGSQQAVPARRSSGWGGQGLGEMKVYKSKLQKDKDAWAKAAAAEEALSLGKTGSAATRKPLLKESNTTIQKSVTSLPKKVPSYMKSTHTSTTRNSIGTASDTDARFAF